MPMGPAPKHWLQRPRLPDTFGRFDHNPLRPDRNGFFFFLTQQQPACKIEIATFR